MTADLLAMAVAAGLTPYLAVRLAARFGPAPVAERLASVLRATEEGHRLAEALDGEALRTPALAPVLALLASGERSGTAVGPALTGQAVSIRARARRRAMARARTIPVRLLFPLVFLVLPAFLVLTVAPVVLAGLDH
ncbi:MAG TPA: type II secretion system F family protein [Acidimicrobiia bacterium]|nr:type II secretion system F family protein [Acidimicrobiia bacterium]